MYINPKKIGGAEYCLDFNRFTKKRDEALLLEAEKEAAKKKIVEKKKKNATIDPTDPEQVAPKKLKISATNIVVLKRMDYKSYRTHSDEDFDKTACQSCVHRKLASNDGTEAEAEDHCFNPPCFEEKARLDKRSAGRRQKMRDYLETWLRPAMAIELPKRLDLTQIQGIGLWLATGAVDHGSTHYAGQMTEKLGRAMAPFLKNNELFSLPAVMAYNAKSYPAESLIQYAIPIFTQDQLRWLALEIKLDLNAQSYPFRIDETYLRMKRKAEMGELAKLAGVETIAGLGATELRDLLLKDPYREAIGVPADIATLYAEPFVAPKDWDDELDIDDDQEEPVPALTGEEIGGSADLYDLINQKKSP